MTGTHAGRIRRTRATVRERSRAENHPDVLGVMLHDCNQIGEIRDVAGLFATAAQAGIVSGLKYRAAPAGIFRSGNRGRSLHRNRVRALASTVEIV
jgi:hypothetical protein